jgi:amino acid transporter
LILFDSFLLSALAVGIVVGYKDEILTEAIATGAPGAGRSPYVAAMTRLKIKGLPHVVNAGVASSIFSA